MTELELSQYNWNLAFGVVGYVVGSLHVIFQHRANVGEGQEIGENLDACLAGCGYHGLNELNKTKAENYTAAIVIDGTQVNILITKGKVKDEIKSLVE